MGRKVLHVVASVDNTAAGTTYSVVRLCSELGRRGHRPTLVTTRNAGDAPRVPGVRVVAPRRYDIARGVMLAPGFRRAIRQEIARADLVHVHGWWLPPNWIAVREAKRLGKPVVLSPRGMLMQWSIRHKRWKKRLASVLGYTAPLALVDAFHVTGVNEAEQIHQILLGARTFLIPNAVDIPAKLASHCTKRSPRILALMSRIHPIKGIDLLLRVWHRLEADFPDWELRIAGPDEGGYARELAGLAAKLGIQRVKFVGPVYGRAKAAFLAEADLFVLPTRSDNYALVVAEALAAAVPVVTTTATPWRGLPEKGCGWSVEPEVASLQHALAEAMALPPSKRQSMGLAGRYWIERDFTWPAIVPKFEDLYAIVKRNAGRTKQ